MWVGFSKEIRVGGLKRLKHDSAPSLHHEKGRKIQEIIRRNQK